MMEHQIELYTSPDDSTQIEVQFEGDSFWLNLNHISSLFEKDKSIISRHLKNVFTSGELIRDSVVAKNATTAQDGKTFLRRFLFGWRGDEGSGFHTLEQPEYGCC